MQMSPECTGARIIGRSSENSGFRLGVMSDFGLDTSEVRDAELDNILYFDCDE